MSSPLATVGTLVRHLGLRPADANNVINRGVIPQHLVPRTSQGKDRVVCKYQAVAIALGIYLDRLGFKPEQCQRLVSQFAKPALDGHLYYLLANQSSDLAITVHSGDASAFDEWVKSLDDNTTMRLVNVAVIRKGVEAVFAKERAGRRLRDPRPLDIVLAEAEAESDKMAAGLKGGKKRKAA